MAFEIRDDIARIETQENDDYGALVIETWREPDGYLGLMLEYGAQRQHRIDFYVPPTRVQDLLRAIRWAAATQLGRLAIEHALPE